MSSNDEGPSYWLEFLKHPANRMVVLAMLAGSVLLSVPWGGDGLGIGLVALAAVEMVGLATVPSLGPFRQWVDRRERARVRDGRRERLLAEIHSHGGSPHLQHYEKMASRVQSLYRMAGDRSTSLTPREVEQLEDLTVDYLRLTLSDAVQRGGQSLPPAVEYKLRDVEKRLEKGGLSRDEELQLRQAKAEYEEAIARQMRMASRRSALEATLLSMPVRLEEVYQMVMTSPQEGNLSQMLEESVSKLRLAEEAARDLDRSTTVPDFAVPVKGTAAPARERRAVGERH